jgi:LacI family transcriptional regulator
MDACREAGLEIPRDLVVISTGIHSEVLPLCRPTLTGAQEDLQRQAQMAVDLLEAMMAGKRKEHELINVPPLGVIERGSTATMAIADREVAHAVEFIRAHGNEPVNVGSIMERAGVSRGTLERRFKQAMGQTPHEYLVQQRVRRAQEILLTTPDASLDLAAKQCGFRDRPELNRVFRRVTGRSPAAWRESAPAPRQSLIHRDAPPSLSAAKKCTPVGAKCPL